MQSYDFVIRNARLIDGTGAPWRRADLATDGQLIASIGHIAAGSAAREVDGSGLYLMPGFIDIHTHGDRDCETMPEMENYVRQGVTTLLGGNCGHSAHPVAGHLSRMQSLPLSINYGLFVGHGSLRAAAMGLEMRAPSDRELADMVSLTESAMEHGAFGMSLGLYYAPGSFAEKSEVVALSRAIAGKGGIVSVHMRDESDYSVGLIEAIAESIDIARTAQVPVQISHLKCLGRSVWGKAQQALDMIDAARAEGLDVTFDQYPYEASGTSFAGAIVPRWALDGGEAALAGRLRDPAVRPQLRADMLANIDRRGGAESLYVALFKPEPDLQGKNLAEIGLIKGMDPVDAAIEMQLAGGASLVSFNMQEEDILTIMRHPAGMVGSDGALVRPGQGMPHPRYYGTFPRYLSRYIRDRKVLPLEEGVRRMTSAPAARVGIWDRGILAPGMAADMVLIDLDRLRDLSSYQDPHHYNEGIHTVMVNGRIAVDHAGQLSTGAGRVLNGPAAREVNGWPR